MTEERRDMEGFLTLDVGILDPPSLVLNTLSLLEIRTVQDLLTLDLERASQTRGVGRGKIEALSELITRAQELRSSDIDLAALERTQTVYLIDELNAAGVELDVPWEDVLRRLDIRTRNLLIRSDFQTLREIALRLDSGTLEEVTGFGQTAIARLNEHLDLIITRGLESYLWGDQGRPEHLDDTITRILKGLESEDHLLFVARFLQNKTLEKTGEQLDISRERVRQRLERLLRKINRRWGEPLEELLGELWEVLDARGGLLSPVVVAALSDEAQREHVTLGLEIIGRPARWCPISGFLTTLQNNQVESLIHQLKSALEAHDEVVTTANALEAMASTRGWHAPAEEIVAFLSARWPITLSAERVVEHPWLDWGRLCVEALERLGRGATIEEIMAELVTHYQLESPPTSRQVYLSLSRNEAVYYVDRGVYLHQRCLPLPVEELRALSEQCIEAIATLDHAVSTASLLNDLKDLQEIPEGLTPMLLRDVMGRDPRIRLFQSTDMVAHLESFSGKRQTQSELLDELLSQSDEPLTCDEVCARIPAHVSYHRNAVYISLQQAPFALNLGQGRFLHRDTIGLTPHALAQVCQRALEALEAHGAPLNAARLLDSLPRSPSIAYLKAHPHGADILYALLCEREEIRAGSGRLVVLSPADEASNGELRGEGALDPVIQLVLELLGEHSALTPGELKALIEERFGWSASSSPLYNALARAVELGLVSRDGERLASFSRKG